MNINDMTKETGKMYMIKENQEWWDGSEDVCMMNSKEQCDEIVAELNKTYNSIKGLQVECENCLSQCHDYPEIESDFNLKDSCGRSELKTDRNGVYCENDKSQSATNSISYYYVVEINIRERI